jgi:CRISPR/Cas system-associated exonuclease Cas4 (RecB family)
LIDSDSWSARSTPSAPRRDAQDDERAQTRPAIWAPAGGSSLVDKVKKAIGHMISQYFTEKDDEGIHKILLTDELNSTQTQTEEKERNCHEDFEILKMSEDPVEIKKTILEPLYAMCDKNTEVAEPTAAEVVQMTQNDHLKQTEQA